MSAPWVAAQYPALANHPFENTRAAEYSGLRQLASRHGIELTEFDFDAGISERFGDGLEFDGWR